jgi:hypothetical protein
LEEGGVRVTPSAFPARIAMRSSRPLCDIPNPPTSTRAGRAASNPPIAYVRPDECRVRVRCLTHGFDGSTLSAASTPCSFASFARRTDPTFRGMRGTLQYVRGQNAPRTLRAAGLSTAGSTARNVRSIARNTLRRIARRATIQRPDFQHR